MVIGLLKKSVDGWTSSNDRLGSSSGSTNRGRGVAGVQSVSVLCTMYYVLHWVMPSDRHISNAPLQFNLTKNLVVVSPENIHQEQL